MRRGSSMIALSVALAAPPAALASELVVHDREPIAMLVFSPRQGEPLPLHQSDVLRRAARAIEPRTDLELVSPEQIGLDATRIARCREEIRMSCWARSVRDPGTGPGTGPALLLVAGIGSAGAGRVRLTALLIDTAAAAARYEGADRAEPRWEEQVENGIFAEAVKAEPATADAAELDDYFEHLVTRTLRDALERGGHWEPFGAVAIDGAQAGLHVELDGRVLGETARGTTVIRDVRAGSHKLRLLWASGDTAFEARVEVARGETSRVGAVLTAPPDPPSAYPAAVLWTGVGLAAVGAAVTTFAAVQPPRSAALDVCAGCSPPSRGFASLCELTSSDPACLQGGKGVLAAPLGYSLLLTGSTFAAGSLVFDEDVDMTWTVAIGVAAGALSYGLSALLDPGRD